MNETTKKFISGAFGPDFMNEPEVLKRGIRGSLDGRGPFTKNTEMQRDGFAELIHSRSLSLTEWEDLTQGVLDFPNEDDMYAYLKKAYDYFFGDAVELPPPPAGY